MGEISPYDPVGEQQHVALLPTFSSVDQNETFPTNDTNHPIELTARQQELLNNILLKMNIVAIDESSLICLLVAYSILIMTGACGNGLVCLAVFRKAAMRTARNVYIINLAVSDLILCLFTMPFTLVEIVLRFWPLGKSTCKLVAGLEAISIFVSTISITAIAIDRYQVIVHPSREQFRPKVLFLTISSIWLFALVLAIPLFYSKDVEHKVIPANTRNILRQHGFQSEMTSFDYCVENWDHPRGRFYYSIFVLVIQYVLPIVIVSWAYARICKKLHSRMLSKGTKLEEKLLQEQKRVQRTNKLLISITVIYILSWLPLNTLNAYLDYFVTESDPASNKILFACCHMCGMSSACSNPFLYGWLNDNFRKEFKEILGKCFGSHKMQSAVRNTTTDDTRMRKDQISKVNTALVQDVTSPDSKPKVSSVPAIEHSDGSPV
ncbi:neuropeptide F receptor [Galendromus occidentalis]|uniref:Neuropeptide F receptor n=1 Tax=Galendromus occidentalis TaxID=34638 RepID=A0AAJ7WHT1_9ACAR|nr:neuropeptide F receptor [Galendromus occidentalis]